MDQSEALVGCTTPFSPAAARRSSSEQPELASIWVATPQTSGASCVWPKRNAPFLDLRRPEPNQLALGLTARACDTSTFILQESPRRKEGRALPDRPRDREGSGSPPNPRAWRGQGVAGAGLEWRRTCLPIFVRVPHPLAIAAAEAKNARIAGPPSPAGVCVTSLPTGVLGKSGSMSPTGGRERRSV